MYTYFTFNLRQTNSNDGDDGDDGDDDDDDHEDETKTYTWTKEFILLGLLTSPLHAISFPPPCVSKDRDASKQK